MLVLLCFANQFCVLCFVQFSPFENRFLFHLLSLSFLGSSASVLAILSSSVIIFCANIRDAQLPVNDPDFPILGGVRLYKFYLTLFPCIAPQGVVKGEYHSVQTKLLYRIDKLFIDSQKKEGYPV